MATDLTDNTCRLCGGSTGETVADHELKADPHPQYLTQTEGDALYADAAEITAAVAAHEADAGDPHAAAGYLTAADVGSFATEAYADAAVATHAGLPDPHPGYVLNAELTTAINNHAIAADPHTDYALESFAEDLTGWGYYQDDTVTSGSPLSLVAATPTDLPNAADTVDATELPTDVAEFYETTGSTIVFQAVGELIDVQVQATVEAVAATDWLDVWLEDSAAAQFARSTYALPKGATAQTIVHRFTVRANANLVANGGTIRVESNAAVDVYDIRYLVSRGHKTRTT